ncbi:hypothetical protein KBD34_04620 [Patescibacteria group bacterium]|nr:hypothetical protein [Patescibacteria group bacterium]
MKLGWPLHFSAEKGQEGRRSTTPHREESENELADLSFHEVGLGFNAKVEEDALTAMTDLVVAQFVAKIQNLLDAGNRELAKRLISGLHRFHSSSSLPEEWLNLLKD